MRFSFSCLLCVWVTLQPIPPPSCTPMRGGALDSVTIGDERGRQLANACQLLDAFDGAHESCDLARLQATADASLDFGAHEGRLERHAGKVADRPLDLPGEPAAVLQRDGAIGVQIPMLRNS